MAKKYIDAEKLIAEIERLREPYQPYLSDFENGCREGRNDVLDDLHSFITSPQQEQPEVDLEKEIDACWQNWLSPSNQNEVEGVLPKTEFATYARHFYELGLNARKEE